jgi:hypothetical protein
MLKHLSIDWEEINDLEEEEEKDVPKGGLKWFVMARVHTGFFLGVQTFEQHMKVAWSPSKEVKIKIVEPNLFYNTVPLSRGLS